MSHPTPPAAPPKPIPPITPEQQKAAQGASGPAPSGPSVPLPPAPADSGPALCGEPHEYKTRGGDTRTKPCVKAKGHSGGHSSRQQSEKVDLTVLAEVALEAEDVPSDDILDVVTERVRDERQQKADKDVAAGWEKWKTAGKPAGVNEAIKKGAASRYIVAPEHVAAVRTLLRRAENAPELKGKIHVKLPPAKSHVSGNKMIYFIVVDKQQTSTTPAAPAAPAAPATPAAPADNKPKGDGKQGK